MNKISEREEFEDGIGFEVNERCGRIELNGEFEFEGAHEENNRIVGVHFPKGTSVGPDIFLKGIKRTAGSHPYKKHIRTTRNSRTNTPGLETRKA